MHRRDPPAPRHSAVRPSLTALLLALVLSGILVPGALLASAAVADEARPVPAGSAVWPLVPAPDVAEGFDPPETRWGPGHRGVDLVGSAGQHVRASLAGTVAFAGRVAGRGVVVVDHGRTRTTYEPVLATVDVGDPLDAGDPVGRLQAGGSHCAPVTCLHWGLLAGGDYLDPLTLVGAGPVRLLPLRGAGAWSAGVWAAAEARPGASFPRWTLGGDDAVRPAGDAALFRGG